MLLGERYAYERAKTLTALLADWLLVNTANVIDDASIRTAMTAWQRAAIRDAADDLAVAVAARPDETAQHAVEEVLRFSRNPSLDEIDAAIGSACRLSARFAPALRDYSIAELCAKYGRDVAMAVALLEQADEQQELSDAEIGVVVAGKIYAWFDHGFAMELRDAIDRLAIGAPRTMLTQVMAFGEQLMHWVAEPASLLVIPLLQVQTTPGERRRRPFSSFEVAIIDHARIHAWYAQRDALVASAKHLEPLVKPSGGGPQRTNASPGQQFPWLSEPGQRGESIH